MERIAGDSGGHVHGSVAASLDKPHHFRDQEHLYVHEEAAPEAPSEVDMTIESQDGEVQVMGRGGSNDWSASERDALLRTNQSQSDLRRANFQRQMRDLDRQLGHWSQPRRRCQCRVRHFLLQECI